jgi:hypothetical protein
MPYKLEMNYTLKVLLFTDVDMRDPDKDPEGKMDLDEASQNKSKTLYRRSNQIIAGSGLEP